MVYIELNTFKMHIPFKKNILPNIQLLLDEGHKLFLPLALWPFSAKINFYIQAEKSRGLLGKAFIQTTHYRPFLFSLTSKKFNVTLAFIQGPLTHEYYQILFSRYFFTS